MNAVYIYRYKCTVKSWCTVVHRTLFRVPHVRKVKKQWCVLWEVYSCSVIDPSDPLFLWKYISFRTRNWTMSWVSSFHFISHSHKPFPYEQVIVNFRVTVLLQFRESQIRFLVERPVSSLNWDFGFLQSLRATVGVVSSSRPRPPTHKNNPLVLLQIHP